MIINTKFGPGDKVWFVGRDGMKKFAQMTSTVRAVETRSVKVLGMHQSQIVTEAMYELAGQLEPFQDDELFESREALRENVEKQEEAAQKRLIGWRASIPPTMQQEEHT